MQLRKECESLKDENKRLEKEADELKVDNEELRREHEQLMTASRTLEETIKKQSLSEESLIDNDAKSKVLHWAAYIHYVDGNIYLCLCISGG